MIQTPTVDNSIKLGVGGTTVSIAVLDNKLVVETPGGTMYLDENELLYANEDAANNYYKRMALRFIPF